METNINNKVTYLQRGWEVTFIKGLNNGVETTGHKKFLFYFPSSFFLGAAQFIFQFTSPEKKTHKKRLTNEISFRFRGGGGGGKGGDAKRKVQKMF